MTYNVFGGTLNPTLLYSGKFWSPHFSDQSYAHTYYYVCCALLSSIIVSIYCTTHSLLACLIFKIFQCVKSRKFDVLLPSYVTDVGRRNNEMASTVLML